MLVRNGRMLLLWVGLGGKRNILNNAFEIALGGPGWWPKGRGRNDIGVTVGGPFCHAIVTLQAESDSECDLSRNSLRRVRHRARAVYIRAIRTALKKPRAD